MWTQAILFGHKSDKALSITYELDTHSFYEMLAQLDEKACGKGR